MAHGSSFGTNHILKRKKLTHYGLNSRKRPPSISDHLSLKFWVVSYETRVRLNQKVNETSEINLINLIFENTWMAALVRDLLIRISINRVSGTREP